MKIEVAAHRGNVALYPQNTLEAFRSAVEIGADSIELDLHMTKDGEIVIAHDGNFMSTADDPRKICEMTLAEVKEVDVGRKRDPKFTGSRVPTLREFLEMFSKIGGNMTVNYEFKDYIGSLGDFAKECADKIIALVDEYGLWERGFVNSFDGRLLEYIDEKYGGRFKLHGFYPLNVCGSTKAKLYCACLWPEKGTVVAAKEQFDEVKALGIRPWVGAGVRREEDVLLAVERGAELFTSNYPAELMEILERNGLR